MLVSARYRPVHTGIGWRVEDSYTGNVVSDLWQDRDLVQALANQMNSWKAPRR